MLRSLLAWRQFSLRTLLLAMFIAAVFCGGYRFGFRAGQDKRRAAEQTEFDSLVYLITTTISPTNGWDDAAAFDSSPAVDASCRIWVAGADPSDKALPSLALQADKRPVVNAKDPFGPGNSQTTPSADDTIGE